MYTALKHLQYNFCKYYGFNGWNLTRVSLKLSNLFFGSNRNKPKLNLFWLFFGLFRETKKQFFRFVSVFRTGIETTKTNRIFSKQTEKNLQKTFSNRGSSKSLIFFLGSNRNKPKLNLFWMFFGLLFHETQQKIFRFVSVYFDVSERYRNNQNKQNLWYGELKRLIF
jgi:hypothetical protein